VLFAISLALQMMVVKELVNILPTVSVAVISTNAHPQQASTLYRLFSTAAPHLLSPETTS